MKPAAFRGSVVFFLPGSSTMPLLKKSEKVKNQKRRICAVELCRNCGVERENFLKILWKIPCVLFSFHSLWNRIFVKKWNFFPLLCKRMDFSGILFNSVFNMLLKLWWKAVDFHFCQTYPLFYAGDMSAVRSSTLKIRSSHFMPIRQYMRRAK